MELMCEERVLGWNSTPPPTSGSLPSSTTSSVISSHNPNSYSPPQGNRIQFHPEEGQKKNTSCFYCKKEGHWVRDCPMKSPKRPPSSIVQDSFPIIHCLCGTPCVVRVSKTSRTFGREFYTCPLSSAKKCNFFKWCKGGRSYVNIDTPTCGCEAGPCHIYKETSGPDAGRRFFVCPIKKGHGACKFSQPLDSTNNTVEDQLLDSSNDLLDEQVLHATMDILEEHLLDVNIGFGAETVNSPLSTLTDVGDSSPSSRVSVEDGDSSYQGMAIECPVVDTPEHPRKLETNSKLSMHEAVSLVDYHQGYDITSNEPLRKHRKRVRLWDPKIDGFLTDSVNDCWDTPQSKSTDLSTDDKALRPILTSGVFISQRQDKFSSEISSAGVSFPKVSFCHNSSAFLTSRERVTENCLNTTVIYQILGFNFKGWHGRLLFSPPRSLIFPAPMPFFFGANLPIVIHIPSSVEYSDPSLLPSIQPSGALLCEPSSVNLSPQSSQGNTMKGSVLEIFKQAAVSLQDEFLSLLESMDFHDHASMLEESHSVFAALERLDVDYLAFKDQVIEYIGRATSLAQVDLSVHDDDRSSRELFHNYSSKKRQLEDISRCHAKTSSALEASNDRLQCLQKAVSRLKDMLLCAEEELACCKVQNMEIDTQFNQISEDKLRSELNLEVIFKEAEEAEKVCQQRQAERDVAKASFEKARSELRHGCNMSLLM